MEPRKSLLSKARDLGRRRASTRLAIGTGLIVVVAMLTPTAACAASNATGTVSDTPSVAGAAAAAGAGPAVGSPGRAATPPAAPPSTQSAATLVAGASYVSPNGSDAAAGSLSDPWRTLQHAADVGTGTVYARSGTYCGVTITRSGLTFLAYPGEIPVVSGDASRSSVVAFRGVMSGTISGFTVQGNSTTYGAGIEVEDSTGVHVTSNVIRNNHSYGVGLIKSGSILVDGNEISTNDTGVEVEYGLAGTTISNNSIHDNLTKVDDYRGRDGVNVYYTTGSTTIKSNTLARNGTHVEYYNSSNITFSGNKMQDGSVLESGTDAGGSCRNIQFVRNLAVRTDFSQPSTGLILRCAAASLFANNTISGFDLFAFDIVDGTQGVDYGGSIEGLKVENNIVVSGRAFSIDNELPASVTIDHNLFWGTSEAQYAQYIAYAAGYGNTASIAKLRSWTGYETNGLQADPKFADAAFHLSAGSPAIDRGAVLPGISYTGAAPDLGCWEGTVANPAVATHLAIGTFNPYAAGSTHSVTIRALDAYGNVAVGYTGSIHFTSSDTKATLPADYTFKAADNGVHTFSLALILKTAGSRWVRATDKTTASITGYQTVTVTPGGATHLSVGTFNPYPAGVSHSVTIKALDAYGNVATGYLDSIHFTSSDTKAKLPADYTFKAADNGIHTFTGGLTLKTAGSQWVRATDKTTASITGAQTGIIVN